MGAPGFRNDCPCPRLICERVRDYDPCDGPPDYFHKGGYRQVSPAKLEGMEKSENATNR